MNDKNFHNSNFFDLTKFAYKDILDGPPWNSISLMNPFILQQFSSGTIAPNFKDKPYVFIGEGTTIHPSVEIAGPAIIGRNCELRHGAFLREGCIIGDNVIIGHAVEVKHSIIFNHSTITHLSYVGDSMIGNNVNISGGVIIANFRLDKKNIFIKTPKEEIDTGMQKFGATIGDNSVIGVNSVLNPGTLLGKNTIVFPLKSISGVHEDNAVLK